MRGGVYDDAELRLPVREVPQAVRGGAANLRVYRPLARLSHVQVPTHTPRARPVLREDREEVLRFERLRDAVQATLESATPGPSGTVTCAVGATITSDSLERTQYSLLSSATE